MKNTALLLLLITSCGLARADEITMSFGEKIPPFVFPETNSGIEVEVIGEALAYRGHQLKPHYYAFARVPEAFKSKQVDGTMTDLGEDLTRYGGHYGDPAVFYDNVFITLKDRHISINKPSDLIGLTVISFQGAAKRYPDWLGTVQKAGHYFEQNDQELQVLTLNAGRYDVVLSDRNIFKYFTLKLKREQGFHPKPVEEHSFVKFNPLNYRPIFRSEKVRDDFNAGLRHLKETGRYQAIYDRYLKE
jgi:polar amino acid transport system substrate-binding protein